MLARPAAAAVVFEGESLSYAELDARANQLAHHLVRHGVGPDVIVGVQLERLVELVVALLAVLKAGGAYLPLDPSYPADRRAFMVADARVPIVIARGPVDFGGRVIDLERDAAAIACGAGHADRPRAGGGQPRVHHLHVGLDRAARRACWCRTRR